MKQTTTLKLAGVALVSALSAIVARADVPVYQQGQQNVSIYGYVGGSTSFEKQESFPSDTRLDLDAAKVGFSFDFAPVTAKVSLYTDAGAHDLYLLEANATYDIGNGLTLTGGRFQSWVGYEAFDLPNQNFITNGVASDRGNAPFISIPNFHEGVRLNYAFEKMTAGVAVVNSIYNGANAYSGDGSLSDGYGIEGHFGYADSALTISATLGYQNDKAARGINVVNADRYLADVWAQYVLKKTTFGGEFYFTRDRFEGFDRQDNYYLLAMVKQQLDEKLAVAGRVSYGKGGVDFANNGIDNATFWKFSVTPSYAVTSNLEVRAETSWTKYNNYRGDNHNDAYYVGVQAIFKF